MKITKNMKIAGATGMTLFSLVASFTAAMAWFAPQNNSVTASGMTIKADNYTTSFVSVEVHKCIPDQCTADTLVFNPTAAYTMVEGTVPAESLIVDDYGDLNKSQPVLLLFNLAAGTQAKNVKITGKVNTGSSWLPDITASNKNSYPLSNAVYFRTAAFDKTGTTGFQFGSISTASLTIQSEFAEFDGNTASSTFVQYYGPTSQITVYSGGTSTETITHVAVVLDYYLPAVTSVQAKATASAIITNPSNADYNYNRLGFSCDWTMRVS